MKTEDQYAQSPRPAAPYEALAGFYDHLMAHVDYKVWARYIIECVNLFGNPVQTLLDAGCGTGSLLRELTSRGFRTFGFDLSFGMLQTARKKGIHHVWQADMLRPGIKQGWDCINSQYDTIHYIKPEIDPVYHREKN